MAVFDIYDDPFLLNPDEERALDAIIEALSDAENTIHRFDSIGQPEAFANDPILNDYFNSDGRLPLLKMNGAVVAGGNYKNLSGFLTQYQIKQDVPCNSSCCDCASRGGKK